ncbi:gliding motility-associated C-terminal domain-containing protein [Flagellimonas olearia]|uniref:T9SS type B sorting domain-containing protein n=1 Tax=Flagellimonas olearia TaxID=552546 RepID=UPI0014795608|nr:gliding motility-associated C-terminal domain-containing protein [Allomuricauda olearia]
MSRIWVLAIFLFLSTQVLWTQIYVSPNGNGNGSGTSWANASTLQDAVISTPANSEIWLRQGTYPLTETILINTTLRIFGGYSGTGSQRNPNAFPSIINGQNAVVMVQTRFSSQNTLFDGISFVNGYSRPGGVDAADVISGGAMYIAGHGTRINNCIFRDNTSENRIGSGAIYLWNVDNIVIENSLFENNSVLQNDHDYGNIGGGAMHIRFGSNNRVENCRFVNNTSHYSGGAIYAWGENAQIVNCHFEGNFSDQRGGAIYVNFDDVHVSNSSFLNNSARGLGGAMCINTDGSTISNSMFAQNTSQDNGGAVYNGGRLSVSNALFNGNTTTLLGGAIYSRSVLEVANSTFVSNSNTAIVHPRSASNSFTTYETNIYNSIFYDNAPGSISGMVLWADVDKNSNANDESTKDFRRNMFQENTFVGNNLLGIDPAFQNFSGGNFRLGAMSPGIDYGNNALFNAVSTIPAGSAMDLDGNPRVFGARMDLGAYERQSASTLTVPNCVSTLSPINNAMDVPLDSNVSWNAVNLAIGYRISIGTTSGGSEIVDNQQLSGTVYNPISDFDLDTTYYVRVIPYNTMGNATGCNEFTFTTVSSVTVPTCTLLSNPLEGATDVPVTSDLNWTAVADAIGYRLRIGTTPNGDELLSLTDVGNVGTYDPLVDFPEGEDIYVQVLPYNVQGSAVDCSVESFTTETLAQEPNCSTITLPVHGSTNVSVSTDISWTEVDNADYYLVSVGTSSGGTDITDRVQVTGTNYDLTQDLEEGTDYFATVVPVNSMGQASGCTEISFRTEVPATVPDCTTVTVEQNGNDIHITWGAIDNADDYLVTIGSLSGGNDIFDSVVTGTSFTDSISLSEETTYYLNVIPRNVFGPAENCWEVIFTTGVWSTIPDCTPIISPMDESINVGVSTDISWAEVVNADYYLVNVGTSSGGTDVVDHVQVTGTNYGLPEVLEEGTDYFATVVPVNSVGQALGCTEISFRTEISTIVPECTDILSPSHESMDMGLNPLISWVNVDTAEGYYLSIGTSPGGTEIVDNVQVEGTSYQVSERLEEQSTYHVGIVPYNDTGRAMGCQEISFTTMGSTLFKSRYGLSPNGDGNNDFWNIRGIENYPDNVVSIYNRWGDMVFQVDGYNNRDKVFGGEANRLSGIGAGTLPEGTYFFQIELGNLEVSGSMRGFLVIKR